MYINMLTNAHAIKKLYTNHCEKLAHNWQLTKMEIDILLFLANNPNYDTAKDIVERRMLSKSHVSIGVEELEKRKFIRKDQDQNDRRCMHLKLTDEVGVIVKEAQQMQCEFFELLYDGITEEEKKMMESANQKINKNIQSALSQQCTELEKETIR